MDIATNIVVPVALPHVQEDVSEIASTLAVARALMHVQEVVRDIVITLVAVVADHQVIKPQLV